MRFVRKARLSFLISTSNSCLLQPHNWKGRPYGASSFLFACRLSYIRRSTTLRCSQLKIAPWIKTFVAVTLAGGAALAQTPDWNALGKNWWSHVQFLADDNLEGRDTGSRGFEKAADYMAEQFRAV